MPAIDRSINGSHRRTQKLLLLALGLGHAALKHHFECKIHHFECKIHYFECKIHHFEYKMHLLLLVLGTIRRVRLALPRQLHRSAQQIARTVLRIIIILLVVNRDKLRSSSGSAATATTAQLWLVAHGGAAISRSGHRRAVLNHIVTVPARVLCAVAAQPIRNINPSTPYPGGPPEEIQPRSRYQCKLYIHAGD